jgi:hypothetical protein
MDKGNHVYHIRWYSIKGVTRKLDNKSQQLWTMERISKKAGCGPCEGCGNSLRSEGAGMLAATLFIALISHHMNHTIKAKCISDNKKLIRRMLEHKHYEEPYPNATLASEYDIIEEIYETYKIYKIESSYYWVRGHQDKHTAYEDLSLEAQINLDADWYAGKY